MLKKTKLKGEYCPLSRQIRRSISMFCNACNILGSISNIRMFSMCKYTYTHIYIHIIFTVF